MQYMNVWIPVTMILGIGVVSLAMGGRRVSKSYREKLNWEKVIANLPKNNSTKSNSSMLVNSSELGKRKVMQNKSKTLSKRRKDSNHSKQTESSKQTNNTEGKLFWGSNERYSHRKKFKDHPNVKK